MPDKQDAGVTPASPSRKKLVALVGAGAAASLLVIVPAFEGTVDHGYRDPVGIPTKCSGDTHNVVVGQHYTKQQCQESTETQLVAHAAPVMQCVPQLKGHDAATAASVDLAYNIGAAGFCRSSAARNFRMGRWVAGCHALGLYTKAGGRELPGLVKRRKAEVDLCLNGKGDMRGEASPPQVVVPAQQPQKIVAPVSPPPALSSWQRFSQWFEASK